MKVIALLALFAFAVNAINLEQYHLGFAQMLNLNVQATQDGLTCLHGVAASIKQLEAVVKVGGSIEDVAMQALQMIKLIKITAPVQCTPYIKDLIAHLFEHTDFFHLEETVLSTVQLYYPEIIREIGQWTAQIMTGQDFAAGATEAYIIKVLVGLEVPATIPRPIFNHTNYVPLNQVRYINEYYHAVAQGLGLGHDFNVSAISECFHAVYAGLIKVAGTTKSYSRQSFDEKLTTIEVVTMATTSTMRSCKVAIEEYEHFLAPIFEVASEDSANFIITILGRIVSKFPELDHFYRQEIVDILEGKFTEAGAETAERLKIVLGGLVDFTQF